MATRRGSIGRGKQLRSPALCGERGRRRNGEWRRLIHQGHIPAGSCDARPGRARPAGIDGAQPPGRRPPRGCGARPGGSGGARQPERVELSTAWSPAAFDSVEAEASRGSSGHHLFLPCAVDLTHTERQFFIYKLSMKGSKLLLLLLLTSYSCLCAAIAAQQGCPPDLDSN